MDAKQIARLFHESYERLAPLFGYKTREASAKPWEDVPEKNKKLMIAVANEVFFAKKKQTAEDCIEDCAIVDENDQLRREIEALKSRRLSEEEIKKVCYNSWVNLSPIAIVGLAHAIFKAQKEKDEKGGH